MNNYSCVLIEFLLYKYSNFTTYSITNIL